MIIVGTSVPPNPELAAARNWFRDHYGVRRQWWTRQRHGRGVYSFDVGSRGFKKAIARMRREERQWVNRYRGRAK